MVSGLSISSVPTLFLKDPQMGDDPELLTDGRGGYLEQIAWVLATQRQEKFSVHS